MNIKNESTQLDKFKQLAQESECKIDEAAFDNMVAALATAEKPRTPDQKKNGNSN